MIVDHGSAQTNDISQACFAGCADDASLRSTDEHFPLAGDQAVGKSSLVLRFVKKQFFGNLCIQFEFLSYSPSVASATQNSRKAPLEQVITDFLVRIVSQYGFSFCAAAFLTQTVQLDDRVVKFEIW